MNPKTRKELLAECACFDLRKTTRAVSRMYDEFLRDKGLNITQFSLLRLIRREKELSISTLGRYTWPWTVLASLVRLLPWSGKA